VAKKDFSKPDREDSGETNHGEAVADPEATPATWTVRHVDSLTVYSDDVRLDVADCTATDEWRNLITSDRHHRQRGSRRQPERLVVATGVVADVVEVAEDERHRAEPLQARPRRTCRHSQRTEHSFHPTQRTQRTQRKALA